MARSAAVVVSLIAFSVIEVLLILTGQFFTVSLLAGLGVTVTVVAGLMDKEQVALTLSHLLMGLFLLFYVIFDSFIGNLIFDLASLVLFFKMLSYLPPGPPRKIEEDEVPSDIAPKPSTL